MGLLDDLKRQAESRKLEEQINQAERNQNLQAVDAALREAFRYFAELANSLNVIKPEVIRSFFIEGGARLDSFRQCNYRARDRRKTVEHRDYLEEVSFRFSWTGPQALVVERDTPAMIQRMRDRLGEYALQFECKESKNQRHAVERAVFTIAPEVLGFASFTGNWDTGKVRLALKNIETLGVLDYQYDLPEVNQALLEELTKLVLGQSNNLRNLGKYQDMMRTTSTRIRPLTAEQQSTPGQPQDR